MRSLGWLVLLAMVGVARAQQAEIVPEMPVDSAVLRQWLHSGDPRLIAWAADFARRRYDAETLAEMPGALEHWAPAPIRGQGESEAQRRAVLAILDALIQGQIRVPVEAIRQITPEFPTQAAILIARLPLSESRSMLRDWFNDVREGRDRQTLARVAAMMMANQPEPDIAARIVRDAEEELRVSVFPVGIGGGSMGGVMGCGSAGVNRPPSGWPEAYGYDLVEGSPRVNEGLLVEVDGDRIEYDRFDESRGTPWCGGVRPLNAVTRHRLIAHWLGVPDSAMNWQPVENASINWTGEAAYETELGAAVEAQRKKLRAMVESLRVRGLLRDSDAPGVMPRLVVTVRCEIRPCPLGDGE